MTWTLLIGAVIGVCAMAIFNMVMENRRSAKFNAAAVQSIKSLPTSHAEARAQIDLLLPDDPRTPITPAILRRALIGVLEAK